MIYVQLLRKYFDGCYRHAKKNRMIAVVILLSGVFGFIISASQFVDFGTFSILLKLPKLSIAWAVIIVLLGVLFVAIEGGYELHKKNCPSAENPLRGKAVDLGRDLFAFLRDIGPEPKGPGSSTDEIFERLKIKTKYSIDVRNGYVSKFGDRVIKIFRELTVEGINDNELEQIVANPPEAIKAGEVREIAKCMFLIAARMDIEVVSKGT
jgi:hypothetical protein